jgi:hypothetical protein
MKPDLPITWARGCRHFRTYEPVAADINDLRAEGELRRRQSAQAVATTRGRGGMRKSFQLFLHFQPEIPHHLRNNFPSGSPQAGCDSSKRPLWEEYHDSISS